MLRNKTLRWKCLIHRVIDWMMLANVTFRNNDNYENFSENVLNYVNLSRSKYNAELTGKAGSGKIFLIDSLRQLLGDSCIACSYVGSAAFNIQGQTLHRVLKFLIRNERCNELKGNNLNQLQISLANKKYLIID